MYASSGAGKIRCRGFDMRRAVVLLAVIALMGLFAWAQTDKNAKEQEKLKQVFELTDDITPPRLLEVATPEYTAEAKKKKIEGDVTITFVCDEKGIPRDVKVKKGLGYGLDENAVAAVNEYRYKPATKDDEPVAVKMEVTVNFFLRD